MGHIMKWLQLILLAAITVIIGWSPLTPAHAQAASPDAYVCEHNGMAQVEYSEDTKQWSATASGPPTGRSGLKFVFRRAKTGERLSDNSEFKWGYFVLGKKFPLVECQNDFSKEGLILCQTLSGLISFYFNRNNLRYQKTAQYGYVDVDGDMSKDGDYSPTMEFGTCSPI
jgi:hypothetical protein